MKSLPVLLTSLISLTLPVPLAAQSLSPVTLEARTVEALDISSTPVGQHLVADPMTATAEVVLDPTRSRSVATFFPGQIDRDLVQPGEEVKAGQVLAHLKSGEVADALSRWLEAESKLASATVLFERERGLRPQQLTTEDEFLAARTAYREALANRTAALQKALLARSREELETLSQSNDFQDLTGLPLVSPIAGTVIRKNAYAGDAVELNRELFDIADLDHLLIEIQVPLKASTFLQVGDVIDFHTVVGARREGTARIHRIDPVVNPTALAVRVFARLDNTGRDWLAGTPVNVDVVDSAAEKVTAVPSTALVTIAGAPHLFLAQSGRQFQPLAVTVGQSSQAFTEITSPLPKEAQVVVSGANLLLAAWEDRAGE